MKFKTNINCSGCVQQVQPYLDNVSGVTHWEVDTQNRQKLLSVEGQADQKAIEDAISSAGFKAEPVKASFFRRLFS